MTLLTEQARFRGKLGLKQLQNYFFICCSELSPPVFCSHCAGFPLDVQSCSPLSPASSLMASFHLVDLSRQEFCFSSMFFSPGLKSYSYSKNMKEKMNHPKSCLILWNALLLQRLPLTFHVSADIQVFKPPLVVSPLVIAFSVSCSPVFFLHCTELWVIINAALTWTIPSLEYKLHRDWKHVVLFIMRLAYNTSAEWMSTLCLLESSFSNLYLHLHCFLFLEGRGYFLLLLDFIRPQTIFMGLWKSRYDTMNLVPELKQPWISTSSPCEVEELDKGFPTAL